MKKELIKRIKELLLYGYSVSQVKTKLINGEIQKDFPKKFADEYIKESLLELYTDVDLKLLVARLFNLYLLCLNKRDYNTALKVWEKIDTLGDNTNEININFIK